MELGPSLILLILVRLLISGVVTNLYPLTGYYYSTRYIGQRLVDLVD